ncbi:MAG: adenine phosphoribosyltransferase, partial [Chloroflexi bacterium]|nr:adenine phosphoribosyltransferase [Chloroflexota bacterium]
GSTEMHIHKDALDGHENLLIIDDLLATGGTAIAAVKLVENFKSKNIIGAGFIINLSDLEGDKKLSKLGVDIHSIMDF